MASIDYVGALKRCRTVGTSNTPTLRGVDSGDKLEMADGELVIKEVNQDCGGIGDI